MELFNLKGKRAMITGATHGLGWLWQMVWEKLAPS